MGHVTRISHEIRRKVSLSVLEYVVADTIKEIKKPCTYEEIALILDESEGTVGEIVEILANLNYAKIGPKSGKISILPLWNQSTKVEKDEKTINPLIHLMHMAIIDPEKRKTPRVDYQWSAAESIQANFLSVKLKNVFIAKYNRDPTNEEIMDSFCMILDNLPPWHEERFSVSRICSDFNGVISEVRAKIKREGGSGKIHASAQAIAVAGNDFVPKTASQYK